MLLFMGLFFIAVGSIGIIRFPDIYSRLQAASKGVTLGTCVLLLGTLFLSGWNSMAIKCGICIAFIIITAPTAAHAIARSAHAFGIKLWDKSVVNQYDGDVTPENSREDK